MTPFELQQIRNLLGRKAALEEQLKDPCRAAGAYREYFTLKDELIYIVPKLLDEITIKDEEIERHKRSIGACQEFTKDCMSELAAKDALINALRDENFAESEDRKETIMLERNEGWIRIQELDVKLAKARDLLILMRSTAILWDITTVSSGDLALDTVKAKEMAKYQLRLQYPDLFSDSNQ